MLRYSGNVDRTSDNLIWSVGGTTSSANCLQDILVVLEGNYVERLFPVNLNQGRAVPFTLLFYRIY